jgi:hypothetical protein
MKAMPGGCHAQQQGRARGKSHTFTSACFLSAASS